MARVVGAGAGRRSSCPPAVLGDRQLDDAQVLLVGQRRRLAGVPHDDEAVRAVGAQVVHEVDERLLVDAQIVVERRDDRGEDGAQVGHRASIAGRPAAEATATLPGWQRLRPTGRRRGPRADRSRSWRVRWSAPDGDFAVLVALTDEGEEVVLTGPLAHVHDGRVGRASAGRWRAPPAHGWQFAVERVRHRGAGQRAGRADRLPGVDQARRARGRRVAASSATAPRTCWRRSTATPARALREVPGHRPARLRGAVRPGSAGGAARGAAVPGRARRRRRGRRAHRAPSGRARSSACSDDPYAISELDGIGFATADALAQALGTPPDAPGRLDAGLVHALPEAERDGHCHLPRAELEAARRAAAGRRRRGRRASTSSPRAGKVVVDDEGRIADARMHAIERAPGAPRARACSPPTPRCACAGAERPTAATSSRPTTQWRGVTQVLEHRLSILTGGPGTGKTATMRALVDLLRAERRTVRLCAPTGKAARRLAETDRRRGDDDPPAAGVDPGRGLRARRRRPDRGLRPADRRRGVDALGPPGRGAARRRRARARTCCSSATSTSSRRSAPGACWRT